MKERFKALFNRNFGIDGVLLVSAVLLAGGILGGCEDSIQGSYSENQPPTTSLSVNEINRSGENRLSSQIEISWWGDDPDGYVVGYEYAINDTSEGDWKYTTATDSVFVLPIPVGNDSADVRFHVRAVDNDSLRDPEGASVTFPIKNTPPEIEFNSTEVPPDTTYELASFGWNASDIDGQQNLSRIQIALNDTANKWVDLPVEENFVSLQTDGSNGNQATADVYLGESFRDTEFSFNNYRLNDENNFMVRVIDQAGAASEIDTVNWYAKEQTSRILLLNDVSGFNSLSSMNFHLDQLDDIGLSTIDYWIINDGEVEGGRKAPLSKSFPSLIDPTLQRTLEQWDYIYWISNNTDRNLTYALEILQGFFDNGGKLFVSVPIQRISQGDELMNFFPIQDVVQIPEGGSYFQIKTDGEVSPVENSSGPTLRASQYITFVRPLVPTSGAEPLYEAEYSVRTSDGSEPYEGTSYMTVKNSEDNFVLTALDLQAINKDENVSEFLDRICIQELGFQQ